MQTTFRIIELMHEFVLFFLIAFPNCFYCDLFRWNKKQPSITDFQLSCTICCLFCRCRGGGDLTVNQFFSSSIWLCCLIITIDKTWSNLSNHDLIFFFFKRRREDRVQESNLMGVSYRSLATRRVCTCRQARWNIRGRLEFIPTVCWQLP